MGEKVCKPSCTCSQKVTTMVLKVDLQCSKCFKKVKKVLCKFPQIQDQVYDEKNNKVIIKVVSCNPEKLRDKLCCKGDGAIRCIEILEPEKPKPPEKPKEEKPPEKPKEPEKPKTPEKPKEPEKPKPTPPITPCSPVLPPVCDCCRKCCEGCCGGQRCPARHCCRKCCKGRCEGPCCQVTPWYCCWDCCTGHCGGSCCQTAPRDCCWECREGRCRGPCYHLCCGQKRCYDGYCGRLMYNSWSGSGSDSVYYESQCTDYISEENPNADCTIM